VIRRTKIVPTLGPATDKEKVLKKILAVVDLVRLNYSHGTADDQARRVEMVRKVAAELGRDIGILADLQGP
jgi:pyruvate kinase